MSNSAQKQVIDLIKRSRNILILPSAPPDGDSIGAAISLYLVLKKLHKEVTVVCRDTIPEVLQFLPNIKIVGDKMVSSTDFIIRLDCRNATPESIKSIKEDNKIDIVITPKQGRFSEDDITFNKGETNYDLIMTVDCADLSQLGELYENNIELFHQIPVINIDHHISNAHFGKINYVDIMASSTTELLLPVIEELGKEENTDLIDEDVATLLLTGIITDTGSFQNANTTPKSFAKAAQLIAYGARQQEIIQHVYKTKQLSQLKLWGRVLSKIQTDEKYRIVWSVVSQQDFKETESSEDETGDIIDELMTNAPGAEVVLLMKERPEGVISVSVRTTAPAIDASKLAEHFGGGGHARAAGFRINDLNLRDAEYNVIEYAKEFQKARLGLAEEPVPAEPMIDVEKLMKRAEQAEQAQKAMEKVQGEHSRSEAEVPSEGEKKEISLPGVRDNASKESDKPPKRSPGRPRKHPKKDFPKLNIKTPREEPQKIEPKITSSYKFED